jgi:hypothetical protein
MPNGQPYPLVNTGIVAGDDTGDKGQVPFTKTNWALTGLVQTAGEIAAGITPVNWNYQPGCVDRYVTNAVPGSTSMVQAFNNAITVSLLSGGQCPVTYGQTGVYLLDSPVNGTWGGNVGGIWVPNHYSPGLTIINMGPVGEDGTNTNTPFFGLFIKHNGPAAFDFTGADFVTLINMVMTTHTSVFPTVGILGSRAIVPLPNPPGGTEAAGGVIQMRGCRIMGHFAVSPYYNYGIETDSVIQSIFYNYSTGNNTSAFCVTATNYNNSTANRVQTSFTTDALGQPLTQATGGQSCTIHDYAANQYGNFGGQSNSDAIYIEGAQSVSVGGWAYAGAGRSLVYFDGTNSASSYFDCTDLSGETGAGESSYGIMYSNNAQTYLYHRIRPRKLTGTIASIYSPNASTILNNFDIGNTHDNQSGAGINIAGTLQFSTCDSGYEIILATSEQNLMIGDPTQWTIGSSGVNGRNKDRWISKSATTTFSLGIVTGTNGWTVSGLTQSGYVEYIARSVKFRIVLSGSIAWTANATIPTLPGFAIASTGPYVCDVIDGTTGAYLSAGIIANTGSYANTYPFGNSVLTLPVAHTTSTDQIVIQGEYLVA